MLPDPTFLRLRDDLTRVVAERVPEWVDGNEHDPGITLLQLIAHLADELVSRGGLTERAAVPAGRLADAAARLEPDGPSVAVNGEPWRCVPSLAEVESGAAVFSVDEDGAVVFGDGVRGRRPERGDRVTVSDRQRRGDRMTLRARWPLPEGRYTVELSAGGRVRFCADAVAADVWSGLRRPRYFEGRLLTADDYRQEQEYFLARIRRHLRALHGWGIVSGLEVEPGSGGTVIVRAGLALDPEGREIQLPEDTPVTVPPGVDLPALLCLEYVEREIDPAPSLSGPSAEPLRIEEGCRILVGASPSASSVPIALLSPSGAGHRVDDSYVAPRAR